MLYKIQSNVFRRYFNLDYCLCNFAPRYQGQGFLGKGVFSLVLQIICLFVQRYLLFH